jgi:hypothetical protein
LLTRAVINVWFFLSRKKDRHGRIGEGADVTTSKSWSEICLDKMRKIIILSKDIPNMSQTYYTGKNFPHYLKCDQCLLLYGFWDMLDLNFSWQWFQRILWCDTMQSDRSLPMFRKNILPPSSQLKRKTRKQLAKSKQQTQHDYMLSHSRINYSSHSPLWEPQMQNRI